MITLRLQRTGRKNLATYRIVAAEKARAVKGKFLEILGHYLPQESPPVLSYKEDQIQEWIGKGAKPSDTLARLLKRAGMAGMDPFVIRYMKRTPRGVEPTVSVSTPPSSLPPDSQAAKA